MLEFLLASWDVLGSVAPWLILGVLITGAMHAWLPRGYINKILTGRGGVLSAVALGIPLPLCSCGVIPAGVGLKEDGASDGATMGFMISTPQTGVDSIMVSAGMLGFPFAIFKVASALVTGVIGGWIADAVTTNKRSVTLETQALGERPGISEGVAHALDVLRLIWGWLLFGVLASAAIELLIPPETMASVKHWGPLGTGLAALVLSLPLYVCATASVPIAAAFVAGGLPAGAALVFLMAGPATNVATMGAVYKAMGGRMLTVYLGSLVIGSLSLGLLFDFVIGSETAAAAAAAHEHGGDLLANLSSGILLISFVFFGWESATRWMRERTVADAEDGTLIVNVTGMTCGNCTGRLERELNELSNIDAASVSLEPGQAKVIGRISPEELRAAIRSSGFEPGDVLTGER